MMDCLFCKIVRQEIPARVLKENKHALAFRDINPQAPTHVLVIPKKHVASLEEATPSDAALLGEVLFLASEVARDEKITSGYRLVLNTGSGAGQSVFHIHVHVLGGRPLSWPPG
ncbi:MAG: histidine triad nucleotide-binding protein [Acidobacteria bacterium]|nr:histidine triad nucleotide-binding protein [Acidobacteriota bacterium]